MDEGVAAAQLGRRGLRLVAAEAVGAGRHLERHGYVERVPDPSDRRAKLVRATARGGEVYALAHEFVSRTEAEWTRKLGKRKMAQLRELLVELNSAL